MSFLELGVLVQQSCTAHGRAVATDHQELISDACHGEITTRFTHNVLICPVTGSKICIREVRYYQYLASAVCPHVLSDDTQGSGCCIHKQNRCSWIPNNVDERTKLQSICEGHSECDLHSARGRVVADPCFNTPNPSTISSVRSIKYNCIDNTTSCPAPGRATTSQNNKEETNVAVETSVNNGAKLTGVTERTGVTELITDGNDLSGSTNVTAVTGKDNNSSPKHALFNGPDNGDTGTGVIVGAVLGTVCVIAIIAIILILYFRRRRQKDNGLRGGPNTIAATGRNPTHYVGSNGTTSFSPGVNVAHSSPSAPFDGDNSTNVVYNTLTGNTEDPSDYTQLEANTTDLGNGDGSYINVPDKKNHGGSDEITNNDRLDTILNEMNEATNDYMNVVRDTQEERIDYVEMEQ